MEKIDKILDRVREKRGIKTRAQAEREQAVQGLLGKPQEQSLRPESQALVDAIRKGR